MPIQKLEVHNGKITFAELKKKSHEFDVESIHTLDLSNRGLNDLTELSYCVGLERLDVSNNRLCRLQWIQDLKLLVHLDVSSNSLSSLESLRSLVSLKYLKVALLVFRELFFLDSSAHPKIPNWAKMGRKLLVLKNLYLLAFMFIDFIFTNRRA